MGQPVVHFEVIGKDGPKLREWYGQQFGWQFGDPLGPTSYAVTQREDSVNDDGVGIAGGVGTAPEGYDGHVTFYVEVPDVGEALDKIEQSGGGRMMGPDEVPGVGITIGLFTDPEGHVIGLVS